jgi:uncharacterized protein
LGDTRVFFVSDLHGSEVCFRKFLNAAKAYRADVLIAGGDVTGKMIVPLVDGADGTVHASYLGSELELRSDDDVAALTKTIRNAGYYPVRMTRDEMTGMDASSVEGLFARMMGDVLRSWVDLAEERLAGSGVRCFMMPGNDDPYAIDEVLDGARYVVNADGKVVDIGPLQMISSGLANMTPWVCPRDVEEDALAASIEGLVSRLRDPSRSIFNLHSPPYDSTLDAAPELDANLTPKLSAGGEMKMAAVGSTAVRNAIERYRPVLGLHGHIHESRGAVKIGRTLCVNPGSDYGQGILRGAVIVLSGKGDVKDWALTAG